MKEMKKVLVMVGECGTFIFLDDGAEVVGSYEEVYINESDINDYIESIDGKKEYLVPKLYKKPIVMLNTDIINNEVKNITDLIGKKLRHYACGMEVMGTVMEVKADKHGITIITEHEPIEWHGDTFTKCTMICNFCASHGGKPFYKNIEIKRMNFFTKLENNYKNS